jgi:Uma2 family endonuclease
MATFISDPELKKKLRAAREAMGSDRYDEVWEGVYMMAPMPDDEHQELVALLTSILVEVMRWPGLGEVRPGVNVSNQREDWKQDYGVPDVAVLLKEGHAENLGTHWFGVPDLAIEIVSPDDRSREKIDFYSGFGVRELLVIDRQPWQLEIYELIDDQLKLRDTSELSTRNVISSRTVPLTFRLLPGDLRPQIQVSATTGERTWLI